MANYAVDDHVTAKGSAEVVMAALEVLLDAIDNTKTIRYIDILKTPDRQYQGVLIVDA